MRQGLHDVSIGTSKQDDQLVVVPMIVVPTMPATVAGVSAAVVTTATVAGMIVAAARVTRRGESRYVEFHRQIRGTTRHLRLDRLAAFGVTKSYPGRCPTVGIRRGARGLDGRTAGRPGKDH